MMRKLAMSGTDKNKTNDSGNFSCGQDAAYHCESWERHQIIDSKVRPPHSNTPHTAARSRRQSELDIETMVVNHRACDADRISYLMEINPKL